MASSKTKQKTNKKPASRAGSASKRSTATRASTKPPPEPMPAERIREMWGVGLMVVAILSGLGLWIEAAGPVGELLTNVFRGTFGVFGLAVPLVVAAGAVLLLRDARPGNPRLVAGSAVFLVSVIGLWHLAAGAPDGDSTREAMHAAGGVVGMLLSVPLSTVAAVPGAFVILMGLLTIGLLILTNTPVPVAAHAVKSFFVGHPGQTTAGPFDRWFGGADEPVLDDVDEPPAQDFVEDFGADSSDTAGDTLVDPARSETVVLEEATPPSDDVVGENAPSTDAGDRAAADAAERAELDGGEEADGPEMIGSYRSPASGQARQLVLNPDHADYQLPSLDLLRTGKAAGGNTVNMERMTQALETMLAEFGVDARVVAVRRGPTVTRFELELGTGVKVNAITKLEKDISYALATPEIRIVAPIPGKVAIGIEVPNVERDHITLGDILRSPEAAAQTHPLTAGIGLDISGRPLTINLAKMPHLLIAGATGSGKSVVMNGIVTSIIMRNTPDQVRMILIDPKRVEMTTYEDIPHLLTRVVTDPKRAKDALDWVVAEMERRYDLLAKYGFRNIDRFNEAVASDELRDIPVLEQDAEEVVADRLGEDEGPAEELMPYILCVIDELSDLMMVAPRDIEGAIVRIAQMARAVGIHLIIATQRPSVNVVTGLIKANVPSRIALSMATGHDSKTILDQHGAEKLIGMGDMLYMPANASKPHRLQGCYVDETEIEKVVEHCKAQAEVTYAENVVKTGQEAVMADVTGDDATDEDLTKAAMELVVRSGLGSTSMLQRKLKVGFARAGRLMDELEEMGIVGPSEGPKARTVLMTVEQLEEQQSTSV
ncbi:FtsK/SpoIIIE family DNA translocase [Euzebya tangerina]|uniref:FtsK/SpoIIIE family DNA translocase n=1 Tax=Euzebya tangerina TaxID=591198 RepID=UPI002F353DF8